VDQNKRKQYNSAPFVYGCYFFGREENIMPREVTQYLLKFINSCESDCEKRGYQSKIDKIIERCFLQRISSYNVLPEARKSSNKVNGK
jgi:hypothetical protein